MHEEYCQYCWPSKINHHQNINTVFQYLTFWTYQLFKPFNLSIPRLVDTNLFWGRFLEILASLQLVKFVSEIDGTKMYLRSLIFFNEAKKRKLNIQTIKVLGSYVSDFKLVYKGKNYYYQDIPLITLNNSSKDIDNKIIVKKILAAQKIPVAEGEIFASIEKAVLYGKRLGYPLVVKPNTGSLSHHVSYPVQNLKQLTQAIKIAKIYHPFFIVEKYIAGNLYRATVVGREHVFICQKDRANITGDGISTIQELIDRKNKNRGLTTQMDTTLHRIVIDSHLKTYLRKNRLNLNTVLSKNKKVYLHPKFILSAGCDIIGYTHKTHPENARLFIKIAMLLKNDLIGIDFICQDIKKTYKTQLSAVIETNSLPYIDMHQNPSRGKPDLVAKKVWDIALKRLDQKKTPLYPTISPSNS